jgi:DNA-binding transcriptional regulator GbsR (MarR family)
MPDDQTAPDTAPMPLSAIGERFVLHWGEMGSRWGVNRTVAQIHALIYLAGRPLHAEEIAATLQVARSNVSTSLRDLLHWNLVRVVHAIGDRRDHYETAHDPWDLLRTIVRERKAREFDPTIEVLRDCVNDAAFAAEDAPTRKRLSSTLLLMESLSSWSEDMLRLDTTTLSRLMKMGDKVRALMPRGKASRKRAADAPVAR